MANRKFKVPCWDHQQKLLKAEAILVSLYWEFEDRHDPEAERIDYILDQLFRLREGYPKRKR